jgi:hypothetical protein
MITFKKEQEEFASAQSFDFETDTIDKFIEMVKNVMKIRHID